MAREFMPKSSALMPYVVVNRDAAVAGVFTVDGEAGSVDLTTKYVQITDYNQRVGSLEAKVTTNTGDITDLKTAVTSINGSIGTINTSLSNKAAKGVNSDITGLTALSGPLRLGGDAVADYDAVTLRQLQASSGGGSGANLTGVMNNFLGAVEWFNGSRAALPAGHIPADGQLVNRADYPDLWAAVNVGLFISSSDSDWLANVDRRAKYSTGNGTTTFRLPDLNGTQTGGAAASYNALFLRGDTGLGGGVGATIKSRAPNIVGSVSAVNAGPFPVNQNAAGNAFTTGAAYGYRPVGEANPGSLVLNIDANKSSTVYQTGVTEISPNAAVGIWLIRANGSYSAANTNFSVINSDTTLPANGTTVYGGEVRSVYQVGGANYSTASLRSKTITGTTPTRSFILTISDSASGTKTWEFTDTGDIIPPAPPAWSTVTYQNGYSNGATATRYRKYMGMVELRVSITAGTDAAVGFSLPAGFRPTEDIFCVLNGGFPTTVSRTPTLQIGNTGNVTFYGMRTGGTYYATFSFTLV